VQGERQAIERAIDRIFDWRDRCDEASILTLVAPDFEFETRGAWSIKPLGAARLGQLAFADALKRLNIEVETIERAYDDVLVEGDAAAVRWTASVRNRGTGPTHTLGSWAYFRFREGQMIECAYYPDSSKRATELGPPFRYSRSLSVQKAD
jgi:ketosteroid isomerase-like protein